jgi:amino acid adenylation domain-containing protein
MSDQAQRITGLSPEKRELLLRRLRQKSEGTRQPIRRQGRTGESFPPSFAQQRLWFLNQLQPDSPFYNVPDTYQLTGRLDVRALERSFDALIRRHEVLRTTFDLVGGEPRQFINDPAPFRLPVTDLSGLAAHEREAETARLAGEEARRLFDLRRDPMLRASLLRLGDEDHVLLMSTHHIASDGWSRGVLMSELTTLYAAYSERRTPTLAELPVQYADFAVWQRDYLTGAVLDEQITYWRERLGGELPVLELPTDRPRPPIPTYRGAYYNLAFPKRVSAGLHALSREHGTTLFMTLLAVFQTLLHRYTGQTDIAVGTPVAGRSRAELEHLIGFFVNMLVLRIDLAGDPTFRELLGRVRQVALGAYAHQDVPFEKLVEELHPRRDMSRNPLFQVAFALQNAPGEDFALSGLAMTPLDVGSGSSRFDIECHLWETPEGVAGGLIYSTDLFDETTIARMVSHFGRLLEAVSTTPDARLSELPLMNDDERRQILSVWNGTRRPYPQQLCLHQLFEAQAARTPARVALVCGQERITYAELDARASRLASRLRAAGAQPEVLVGVLAERSTQMLIGILGALKSGAAYVPLDPQYPQERLAFMMKDSRMSVLLTQQRLTERVPSHDAHTVLLDDDTRDESSRNVSLSYDATPDNLAYIIYTSGSTGTPKGVAIPHRSAVAFLAWAIERFTPDELSATLASTSICFDLSIFELFAPLACGGRVMLAENALALPALPAASEVTLINTVPSAMAELVRMDAVPSSVGVVNLAGEPLKGALVAEVYRRANVRRVFNLYGPSEDTTYTTEALVERDSPREPTIGRPVSNGEVYVLDGHLRPVPPGITGELHVGGAKLARGYLNRPALTAERFIPHPFSEVPGARLYKTGDLARFLPDGRLDFVGRLDNQLKIRGFRIEPGEIETALARHAAVSEAAVVARAEADGDKRLVAYVACRPEASATPTELRAFLRERLPEHMIPTGFVLLDALPLTANGKINRRALQAITQSEPTRQGSFVAPRDALELQLARLWEEILRTSPVGVRDNFFDLGGHSLLAVRLLSQLRRQFARDLPLAALLQAQTIEELARLLRQDATAATTADTLVALRPDGSRTPFFCVHPVGGNVLCYLDLARRLDEQQPLYGLQANAQDVLSQHPPTIEALAASYIDALRAVQPDGRPYLLGGWSMGGVVAFEMARQLRAQGERVALVALLDSYAPHAHTPTRTPADQLLLQMFAEDLGRLCGVELMSNANGSHAETPDEHLSHLLRRGIEAGVVPPGIELDQLRQLFQIFKTNLQALASYAPEKYDGRVTLLRAGERFDGEGAEDECHGWSRLAAVVESHVVAGDHYTMLKRPHVDALAERLDACLEAALASGVSNESAATGMTKDHLWRV